MNQGKKRYWEHLGPVPFVPKFLRSYLPSHKLVAELVVLGGWAAVNSIALYLITAVENERVQLVLTVPVIAFYCWIGATFYSRLMKAILDSSWEKKNGVDDR